MHLHRQFLSVPLGYLDFHRLPLDEGKTEGVAGHFRRRALKQLLGRTVGEQHGSAPRRHHDAEMEVVGQGVEMAFVIPTATPATRKGERIHDATHALHAIHRLPPSGS
jgi:hypothetical protein